MPTLLRLYGYVFSFYSNENNELPHVHVEKGDGHGKIWLEPEIEIESLYGFNPSEKKKILKIIGEHSENFKTQWYDFFNR